MCSIGDSNYKDLNKDLNMNEAPQEQQEDQVMTEQPTASAENPENPPDLM